MATLTILWIKNYNVFYFMCILKYDSNYTYNYVNAFYVFTDSIDNLKYFIAKTARKCRRKELRFNIADKELFDEEYNCTYCVCVTPYGKRALYIADELPQGAVVGSPDWMSRFCDKVPPTTCRENYTGDWQPFRP